MGTAKILLSMLITAGLSSTCLGKNATLAQKKSEKKKVKTEIAQSLVNMNKKQEESEPKIQSYEELKKSRSKIPDKIEKEMVTLKAALAVDQKQLANLHGQLFKIKAEIKKLDPSGKKRRIEKRKQQLTKVLEEKFADRPL